MNRTPPLKPSGFFRIAQEALQNIIKHAHASEVIMTLEMNEKTLHLTIQNNGKGFDAEGEYAGHLGLMSMRERVEKHGGTLKIQNSTQKGTTIEVEFTET